MAKSDSWYKLDNAAKIFPSSMRGADTRVFRIVCELTEEVDEALLQKALDLTLAEFPHIGCVLRKGLFWYYLDSTRLKAVVTREDIPALSALYHPGRRELLYRVSYFRRRINLEMFHVLADGSGGFIFMRAMVVRYLQLAHPEAGIEDFQVRSSVKDKTRDAFSQYYQRSESSASLPERRQLKQLTGTRAYRLKDAPDPNMECHLVEGVLSAKRFVEEAHKYEVTAGVLSVALIVKAVADGMSMGSRNQPIVVTVPVDLRQFYPSETTRNFFGVLRVDYLPDKTGPDTLARILPVVKEAFETQLSPERIQKTMLSYSALEHNAFIKMVPLWIKDMVIRSYTRGSRNGVTLSVSNLGRIKMPEETLPYILGFSPFMASGSMQICICSYGDRMVFGAAGPHIEHSVLMRLIRSLVEMGIDVELATNDFDAETETPPAKERVRVKKKRAGK